MALVLAIEPDLQQAAILKRIVHEKVRADVVIVDSRDAAVQRIGTAVPDVVLLSALLSPRDEDELVAHLRTLAGAEHLQTHTIPQLASSPADRPAESGGRLRKMFRRRKEQETAVSGCDPDLFADEISSFLEQAAQRKTERSEEARYAADQDAISRSVAAPVPPAAAALSSTSPATNAEQAAPGGATSWESPFEWRRTPGPAQTTEAPEEAAPAPVVETRSDDSASALASDVAARLADLIADAPEEAATPELPDLDLTRLDEAFASSSNAEAVTAAPAEQEHAAGFAPDPEPALDAVAAFENAAAVAPIELSHIEAEIATVVAAVTPEEATAAEELPLPLQVSAEAEEPVVQAEVTAIVEEPVVEVEAVQAVDPVLLEIEQYQDAVAGTPVPAIEPCAAAIVETQATPIEHRTPAAVQRVVESFEAFAYRELFSDPEPVLEVVGAPVTNAALAEGGEEILLDVAALAEPAAETELPVEVACDAAAPAAIAGKRIDFRDSLGPLASWARLEPTDPRPGTDTRDLIARLSVPGHIAGVSYARGVRIRRVRVPGGRARRKPATKASGAVILSRRLLEEQRASAR